MIVAEFPTEVPSTYYVPPIKKKDSLLYKSIPARGKIITMWRNRKFSNKKLEGLMNVTAGTSNNSTNGKIIINKFK